MCLSLCWQADPMVQSNIQRFVEGLVVSTRFIFIATSAKKVLDRIRTACVTVLVRQALECDHHDYIRWA
jgi:hypothetical protein